MSKPSISFSRENSDGRKMAENVKEEQRIVDNAWISLYLI